MLILKIRFHWAVQPTNVTPICAQALDVIGGDFIDDGRRASYMSIIKNRSGPMVDSSEALTIDHLC